jgi:sporulation protein YlmC with PRC-barrel domain
MLHKAKELIGDTIAATDGPIGHVNDIYFDDQRWGVRYFVVDTGGWLGGRKVLVSPAAIDRGKSTETAISVKLSRQQVEESPGVDSDKPVSRQYEEIYARYYGYPYYWADAMVLSPAAPPSGLIDPAEAGEAGEAERKARESHLHSSGEVIGHAIAAIDGPIGHVEDLLVDDEDWSVADLVVDTRNWLPGKKVVVPPDVVEAIDWSSGDVRVRMLRDQVKAQSAAP